VSSKLCKVHSCRVKPVDDVSNFRFHFVNPSSMPMWSISWNAFNAQIQRTRGSSQSFRDIGSTSPIAVFLSLVKRGPCSWILRYRYNPPMKCPTRIYLAHISTTDAAVLIALQPIMIFGESIWRNRNLGSC
jgi:hypothetical protein